MLHPQKKQNPTGKSQGFQSTRRPDIELSAQRAGFLYSSASAFALVSGLALCHTCTSSCYQPCRALLFVWIYALSCHSGNFKNTYFIYLKDRTTKSKGEIGNSSAH